MHSFFYSKSAGKRGGVKNFIPKREGLSPQACFLRRSESSSRMLFLNLSLFITTKANSQGTHKGFTLLIINSFICLFYFTTTIYIYVY